MANLRLVKIKTSSSTLIRALFSDDLNPFLNTDNVVITSNTPGVADPEVRKISVSSDILNITTSPLTPLASYFVKFKSTNAISFKSKNGTSFLLEDGRTNVPLLIGPEDPADPTRENLLGYLRNNIYNIEEKTVVRDIINSQANVLSRALHDVRQLKNDNYLEVLIEDEPKTRGSGPYDRLSEEGAFEVVRVATTQTNATLNGKLIYDSFPSDPITLQQGSITSETLSLSSTTSTFDNLTLTVEYGPVISLTSVKINYGDGSSANYDIESFGYQINNPRYDTDFASTLLSLTDNQFKLNDDAVTNGLVPPKAGDQIVVSYKFKSLGKIVNEDSIEVWQVLDAVREVAPPLSTKFSLQHAPVVNADGDTGTLGDITFLDPLANPPFSDAHPAFLKELPFRLDGLPHSTGEYCVDYETGTVYAYGAETDDGSGYVPPVATYQYKKSFVANLDYTFDVDTFDLVANPNRELIEDTATITFLYEKTLVPDLDFVAQVHQEVLNERIDNRLLTTGSLRPLHFPVTNVFRVYNETTGEIYALNRFNDDTIFFNFSTPPNISGITRERALFEVISNTTLVVDSEFTNVLGTRIFKILLPDDNIMSSTDDVIGSSFNSSVAFSNPDIFSQELYFEHQILSADENTDRLLASQYQVDYVNGVIYVGVANDQGFDLGTVNYKKPSIMPENSHVISVSEIYQSISPVLGTNKTIDLLSFDEGSIIPSSFDLSDERFLNSDMTLPYVFSDYTITVSDDIKKVRHIFDLYDLLNNLNPVDFGEIATTDNSNVITLDTVGVEKKENHTVVAGGEIDIDFISPGIEIAGVSNVIRVSDGVDLWDSSGTFSGYTITLSGAGSPVPGDEVLVIYSLTLNAASTPIVDYNRGDYFIDYLYLADEILVSYEYGDNLLDFRESSDALLEGDQYFVTYKVGALRDALLANFGTLVDLPIMSSFDTQLERERYRDALKAALQSFTKGPTIPAIKSLVSNISHIEPEVIEAAFDIWSLGVSDLYLDQIDWTGTPELTTGKFDNGILVSAPEETVSFPVSSNLKLDEGTMEMWVVPHWDGLDNDATLTFDLYKDGNSLSSSQIFIGASSFHPTLGLDNTFTLNRYDDTSPVGLPSSIYTNVGIFIYYDDDANRWKVLAKDKTSDGYVYSGTITTAGEMYDVKFIDGLGEINDELRSENTTIEFTFNIDAYDDASPDGYVDGYSVVDGYSPGDGYVAGYSFDGITFMSDKEHYLFDFASSQTTNRFSLYKDGRGYLNFSIYNRGNPIPSNQRNQFKVSADISDWKGSDKHHVAISWKINTSDRRDEMHLFVDGFEVPNIMRYGGRPISASTDRFRTVKPEIILGTITRPLYTDNDLILVSGSNIVSAANTNFDTLGILPGDTIEILETGFGSFTVLAVSGNTLTLSAVMPTNLSDARYALNPFSTVVSSEIDLASNITVSILSGGIETELPGLRAELPDYYISKNMLNQNVFTLLADAVAGDQILIRTLGLNHRRCREKVYVWGDTSSVLKSQLPPPINLNEVSIVPVLLPITPIGPDNAILAVNTFTAAGLAPTQPSNETEGRRLSVRVTGGNVDFSTPASITIYGTTAGGPLFETLLFSEAGTQITSERFKTITSATAVVTAFDNTIDSAGVEIREAFSITEADGNSSYPIVRFSYKTTNGTTLEGDGSSIVSDLNNPFLDSDVDNVLVITSPASVAGTYTVEGRVDEHSITITPTPATAFTDGIYSIYDITIGRSGFQNGFFTLESVGSVAGPYTLKQGVYEFDYATYLEIPIDPVEDLTAYIGSDFEGNKQANAIIDEFRILSKQLTDVRVGETSNTNSITSDAIAIRPFHKNSDTLMLIHFDSYPLTNDANYYTTANKEYIQSDVSVNSDFSQSILLAERPLVYDNLGYLSTKSEGTIEFWVSPQFDSYNDPHDHVYFDAFSAAVEEATSISKATVKITGRASQILGVRLQNDIDNTGTDFFVGGSLQENASTITLGRALPYQQTPVKIIYIPSGLVGDRISIYKDTEGFINFNVRANGTDFKVSQPIFWQRDSWHRIMATYKFNRKDNRDQIRLFVDGEERGVVLFGSGLLFGASTLFGQGVAGYGNSLLTADINFSDPINRFSIGADYLGAHVAKARIDNLRLSNVARTPITVANQAKDINYNSNLDIVLPVIEDAYTSFLLDFDRIIEKNDDFAVVRDEKFGIFNFTLNIFDSFGIILSNPRLQQILEELIAALKPAQSKATLNYIE